MAEEKILAEGTTIDVAGSADEKKAKVKQVRYIFKDPEKGWFEKERDNVRVTKYYKTQKEAIEAAIRENYDGSHLDRQAAARVLSAFGPERTSFVLASTASFSSL